MLINILKRNGDVELRQIQPGQKLVGLRITSFVLESVEDAALIFKHKEWFERHVLHCFRNVK